MITNVGFISLLNRLYNEVDKSGDSWEDEFINKLEDSVKSISPSLTTTTMFYYPDCDSESDILDFIENEVYMGNRHNVLVITHVNTDSGYIVSMLKKE